MHCKPCGLSSGVSSYTTSGPQGFRNRFQPVSCGRAGRGSVDADRRTLVFAQPLSIYRPSPRRLARNE